MNVTMIIGLTVLSAILALMAYQIACLKNLFPKKSARDYLAEKERKEARKFFGKHANIKGTPFRKTTLTRFILDAKENIDVVEQAKIQKLMGREYVGDQSIESIEVVQRAFNMATVADCPTEDINYTEINNAESAYEKYITEELRLFLGDACKCDPPPGYCPWAVEMIKEFIVDTSVINLVSIRIIDPKDNRVISTSSHNDVEDNGTFRVIHMSNEAELYGLGAGEKIRIELYWTAVGSDQLLCINLCNFIPPVPEDVLALQNGQQNSVPVNHS